MELTKLNLQWLSLSNIQTKMTISTETFTDKNLNSDQELISLKNFSKSTETPF